jgi:hypothetical protein
MLKCLKSTWMPRQIQEIAFDKYPEVYLLYGMISYQMKNKKKQ